MNLKLAFAVFHYFPYGGLERNMLAMALKCVERGHQVTIYTQRWEGPRPENILVVELPVRSLSNHDRALEFSKKLQAALDEAGIDLVVGFNKMPYLDICYAADVCFAQKAYEERGWLYRLSRRCRYYLALEKAVFDENGNTEIMVITSAQVPIFQRYYHTPSARMHLLPPGIKHDRIMPSDYDQQRIDLRKSYGLGDCEYLVLMVGSDFKRKGVERSIHALAALSEPLRSRARLWVAGQDDSHSYIALSRKLDVHDQVKFLGARDDIPQLMWAADAFLHPAHSEAAGAVLLEAVVAGLPVITTDVCGFAHYVEQHEMGLVLTSEEADNRLHDAIASIAMQDAKLWRYRGQELAKNKDLFSRSLRGAEIIEAIWARRS